jgi:hypothetical protein
VKCQWVNKTEITSEGVVECHKARLVAKGFCQKEGIEYTGIFSPVANINSIQLIFSLSTRFVWKINHMD